VDIAIDVEHSRILEQLPMFAMIAFFALMAVPMIPANVKSPIMLIGLGGIFIFMLVSAPIAQFVASQYIPIKVRIRPWNVEKTFFCRRPAGGVKGVKNLVTKIYTTTFELAFKTEVPIYGKLDGIEVEHRRSFDERNIGGEVWVMFMGQEVKVARGILAEFWVTADEFIKIDHQQRIGRFELAVGGDDYNIAMKNRENGNVGPYEIDLREYS
jgi:hypothetical protein